MFTINRTNSRDPDFLSLVAELDAELAIRDGEEHAFYAQYNKVYAIDHVVVAYENDEAVACGAIKPFAAGVMELKRMYTKADCRGRGIAACVVSELERWAVELGSRQVVLETGKKQPEAIGLYQKLGYVQIENFGPYAGVANSVCFRRVVQAQE